MCIKATGTQSDGLRSRFVAVAVAVFATWALTPFPAQAYIDPISGSIILQVIGAALLAGVLTIKKVWRRVGDAFRWIRSVLTGRSDQIQE